MNPAFFGVRFEIFPENAQFNATRKGHYIIHPNKCTMKKGNPSNWLATLFFNFDPPKTGETIVMIPGFHSWLIFFKTHPNKKKTRKTRRFVPFKQPL